MKAEKKIFIDRRDTLEGVISRIGATAAERIILNIPRDAAVGSSVSNFHTLKEKCASGQKELIVESVDDHILELAALARVGAVNPIFRTRERAVSDIIPRAAKTVRPHPLPERHEERPVPGVPPVAAAIRPERIDALVHHLPPRDAVVKVERHARPRGKLLLRWATATAAVAVVAAAVYGLAAWVLPRATVTLVVRQVPVAVGETVSVKDKVQSVDVSGSQVVLPGELLVATKNAAVPFSASGRDTISTKATGTLVISNGFSTESQVLVATTRFESPERKVFRLVGRVTVPGATSAGDKIQPSTIRVAVVADQVGESYNVGSSTGWRIPGFQGTPKYEGFSAAATEPMTGGSSGERPVPTPADLAAAKQRLREILRDALESQMSVLLLDRFSLLDGASGFTMLQEQVQQQPNDAASYSIFGEAEMRKLVFDTSMFKNAIVKKVAGQVDLAAEPEPKVRAFNVVPLAPQVNLRDGAMTFTATGSIIFEAPVDVEGFKQSLLGTDEATLRAKALAISGLERVQVSLWPFWVSRVPENPAKVEVVVR